MYKVSVIVPVYNGEKYIDECIKSIQNQSLTDIEIICVDDGSTDSTPKLLNEYASKDSRIKIISKTNSGYGSSMNVGIEASTGEYIGIVEADDYIEKEMYERLYQMAIEKKAEIVKSDYSQFLGDGEERKFVYKARVCLKNVDMYNRTLNYDADEKIFDANMLTSPGIYKRSFLVTNHIKYNETPGASYQDNGFWFQTMMYADGILFLKKSLYNLRRDNENSSVYNPNKVFCIMDEYNYIRELILKSKFGDQKRQELLQIQWLYRWKNCENDMLRIANQFYYEFCNRFRKEMQLAIEMQEFDGSLLNEEAKERLFALLSSEERYIRYYSLGNLARKKFLSANSIVIYGAQWNARRVLSMLRKNNMEDKLRGIVVSDKKDADVVLDKVFVTAIDDCRYDDDTLFVIATSEKYVDEIKDNLRKRGYANFLVASAITE